MADRGRVRQLATAALEAGDGYVDWFDRLYQAAARGEAAVPWADLVPNPMLATWLAADGPATGRALDVGCGYGDNATVLAQAGYSVDAFDVSAAAVERARERFGDLARWSVSDALAPPEAWRRAFDLVVEVYTLQVLPPTLRARAGRALGALVAPGGRLLVIARGRDEGEPEGALPWPLTRAEIEGLAVDGLTLVSFEDLLDDEDPPVRRFRAVLERTEPNGRTEPGDGL